MNKIPLLITSSVVPSDITGQLNDPKKRIEHTFESLDFWVSHIDKINIVVCDGSRYDFTPSILARYPNINIECLSFQNDTDKVNRLGKGYGEGEIVKYALNHSKTISSSSCFIKCTAKLWIKNIEACLKQWNGIFLGKAHFENILSFNKTYYSYFDTRFYISNIDFYRQHFIDIHHIPNLGHRVHIEDSFTQVLKNINQKNYLFRPPPIICGVQGASGKYYKASLRRQIKDQFKNYLVARHPLFRDLFVNNVSSACK